MAFIRSLVFGSAVAAVAAAACSAGDATPPPKNTGSGGGGSDPTELLGGGGEGTSGGTGLDLSDAGRSDKPPAMVVDTLPSGFAPGTAAGGYRVLGPLDQFEEPANQSCVNVLRAIIRDFTQSHIDFGQQKPASWVHPGLYTNQILPTLGDTRKPEINPSRVPLDVIESLEDWYVNTENVNVPYVMDFWLEPDAANEGSFVFDMNNFFPLDDHNENPEDMQQGGDGAANGLHNFLFTTEIHTAFEYKAGQVFTFRGDDDVFVFINNELVVDLGGIHGPVEGSVNLDAQVGALGLVEGEVYALDLFQAERNPGGSNFKIDTSLDFKECGILESDVIR